MQLHSRFSTKAAALFTMLTMCSSAEAASARADFNGDGWGDLATGIPGKASSTGEVLVIYGGVNGLTATGNRVFHQGQNGLAGAPAAGKRFGAALATGDFDGDGYADLAVGVPGANRSAGEIHVLYGSSTGLQSTRNRIFDQNTRWIASVPEDNDRFGSALSSGDFNGDGRDDLAIGVPGEDNSMGMVHVLYGAPAGLMEGLTYFTQDSSSDMAGMREANDRFGWSLASGDFGKNGRPKRYADLAIGVPGEDSNRGVVQTLHGSANGLTSVGNEMFSQNTAGALGVAEDNDQYGHSLAAANFGRNGSVAYDDLAIGVPGENSAAGAVAVLYGSDNGLTTVGNNLFAQDTAGIASDPKPGEHFGWAVAAAQFGGTSEADLAIGVPGDYEILLPTPPGEPPSPRPGAVHILLGSANGLIVNGRFYKGSGNFGEAVSAANFGRGSFADLAVGAPRAEVDTLSSTVASGAVTVLYEPAVTNAFVQVWSQQSPNIAGVSTSGDSFGKGLPSNR